MAAQKQKLTQRQLQSQKVSREKASRKRREQLVRRVQLGLLFTVTPVVAGVAGWLIFSGKGAEMAGNAGNRFYSMTANAGFAVDALYLEGRGRTSLEDVKAAIQIKSGTPILQLSLAELRERLEKIPTVKEAAVERALPHTLHVRITEREPVAIWQHQGALSLVDDEGAVVSDVSLEDYRDLPLVVGEGAPKHVKEALALFEQEEDLKNMVEAAVRVGDRRWNMRLKGGIDIKLPEDEPAKAWKKLANLQREKQLLQRDIRAVDLRDERRVTVRLGPTVYRAAPAPTSAKEA